MPSYEYTCATCPLTLTIMRGIKEEEHKPICANCAKVMTRQYETPKITLKGDGWAGTNKSV